jgi:hypothetical protein
VSEVHHGLAAEAQRHLVDGIQEQVHEQLATLDAEITGLIGAPHGVKILQTATAVCPLCGRYVFWLKHFPAGTMDPHYQCSAGCKI